jgi:pilus assembly protein Flp/PilA
MFENTTRTYSSVQLADACWARSSVIREETTVQRNYLRCREFALNELQQLLQRSESGQGMVEYALVLVLIAIVVIVILTTAGKQVNNVRC